MKTNTFLLCLLLAAPALHAQISLDTSDMPRSGQSYQQVHAASLHNYQHTAGSGAPQNWDYSAAFSQTSPRQQLFISPDLHGDDSIFPAANLLSKDSVRGNAYYIKKADGFYLDGIFTGQGNSSYKIDYNPDELLLPLPISLGNSRQYNSGYDLFIRDGNNRIKIEMRTENDFLADAFGALKLPSGYYPATLRIKRSTRYHSKVYFFFSGQYNLVHSEDSNSTEYSWYAKGTPSWLMRVNADLNGVFQTGTYIEHALTHSAGMPLITPACLAYPNPASRQLFIQWEPTSTEAEHLELLGSDGRLLMQEPLRPGAGKAQLNLEGFAPGLYLIRVYGPASLIFTERIQLN